MTEGNIYRFLIRFDHLHGIVIRNRYCGYDGAFESHVDGFGSLIRIVYYHANGSGGGSIVALFGESNLAPRDKRQLSFEIRRSGDILFCADTFDHDIFQRFGVKDCCEILAYVIFICVDISYICAACELEYRNIVFAFIYRSDCGCGGNRCWSGYCTAVDLPYGRVSFTVNLIIITSAAGSSVVSGSTDNHYIGFPERIYCIGYALLDRAAVIAAAGTAEAEVNNIGTEQIGVFESCDDIAFICKNTAVVKYLHQNKLRFRGDSLKAVFNACAVCGYHAGDIVSVASCAADIGVAVGIIINKGQFDAYVFGCFGIETLFCYSRFIEHSRFDSGFG